MIYILIFSLCCLTGAVYPLSDYSYTHFVGRSSGNYFSSSSGKGRITGVQVWERSSSYIRGFQLRYGSVWTPVFGLARDNRQHLYLFDDEAIVQISGKYSSTYIYQLIFITNKGRTFSAGQPTGKSFSFYPAHKQAELRAVRGRANSNGITSLATIWATVYPVYM